MNSRQAMHLTIWAWFTVNVDGWCHFLVALVSLCVLIYNTKHSQIISKSHCDSWIISFHNYMYMYRLHVCSLYATVTVLSHKITFVISSCNRIVVCFPMSKPLASQALFVSLAHLEPNKKQARTFKLSKTFFFSKKRKKYVWFLLGESCNFF